MEFKILQKLCDFCYEAHRFPVQILEKGTRIAFYYSHDNIDSLCDSINEYFKNDETKTAYEHIRLSNSSDSVASVCFDVIGTDYQIVMGPIKHFKSSNVHFSRSQISSLNLDEATLDYLHEIFQKITEMDLGKFVDIFCFVYTAVNHEIAEPNVILESKILTATAEMNTKVYESLSNLNYNIIEGHIPHDYEKQMIHNIKHGHIEVFNNPSISGVSLAGRVGKLGFDDIRHTKNMIETLNTLCIRAAIDGGVDEEVAYTMGELYVQKIESLDNVDAILRLAAIIPKDYCKKVCEVKNPPVEDIIISKATKYIEKNVYKKISASEIAEYLKISKEYLSTKFKKVMNMSIPDYINLKKVEIAKNMLEFTDNSLIEISDSLSFSSQSYFQNIFKKITGMTPIDYKKEVKKPKD